MKLNQVLEQHKLFSKETGLENNLGDGFLYHTNKIYRAIRKNVHSLNYSFSQEKNDHFIVLPFAQLNHIFTTKTIVLVDNVSVLKAIDPSVQKIIDWDEIEIGYRRNYLFHESCHTVAHEIFKKNPMNHPMIQLLLEEAFANTCELFGMAEAQTIVHQIFYGANSYSVAFEDIPDLNQSIQSLGFNDSFKFTVLAYLHSNFLFSRFSVADFKHVSSFVFKRELSKKEINQAAFLSQMAFSLDEHFKKVTRSLHFKLHQYSEVEFTQLRSEYLKKGLSFNQVANILDSMIEVFYT